MGCGAERAEQHKPLAASPDLPLPRLPSAVHSLLKSAFNTVAIEKEKIKQILSDQDQSDQSAQITSLRKSLSQVTNISSCCLSLLAAGGGLLLGCIMTLNGGMRPQVKPSLFCSGGSSFKAVGPITRV